MPKRAQAKTIIYWLLPLFLTFAQLAYSLASTHQIRFEELSESVRNPFWLSHRTIYDGMSSNVGWDIPVMLLYYLLGFSLHLTKWFRLCLQALSLLFLALLLKRWLGTKRAWIPLLIIGLSPTWLFFNTLQAQFGIDLQYLPICLYLLFSLDFSQRYWRTIKTFLLWSITMIGAMSYPTFIFYIPFLGLLYLIKISKLDKQLFIKQLGLSAFSFFLPFFAGFLYVTNRHLLINDPNELNAGIFRGGGRFVPLERLLPTIYFGIKRTLTDLFIEGRTYYFEVLRPEFSHPVTLLSVVVILLLSLWLVTKKEWKLLIISVWLLLLTSLIVPNFSDWAQGIRRNTPTLVAFYILFCLVWAETTKIKSSLPKILKVLALVAAGTLLLHHLKVYRDNYLITLPRKSPDREQSCFNIVPDSPSKSLQLLTERAKATGKLDFTDIHGQTIDCRLVEVYAAVAANCRFNHLDCPQITWYLEAENAEIPLSTNLWNTYYFPH